MSHKILVTAINSTHNCAAFWRQPDGFDMRHRSGFETTSIIHSPLQSNYDPGL